jgi:hypothetical protein
VLCFLLLVGEFGWVCLFAAFSAVTIVIIQRQARRAVTTNTRARQQQAAPARCAAHTAQQNKQNKQTPHKRTHTTTTTNAHLDRRRVGAGRVVVAHPERRVALRVGDHALARHAHAQQVPAPHRQAAVRVVLHLDAPKLEGQRLERRGAEVARRRQLAH